jgi:hypothetical protein
MRSGLRAVAFVVALLGAGMAAAGAPDTDVKNDEGGSAIQTERRMSEFAPDALPTPYSPFHLMRANAVVARAFEFFGDAKGFALGADWMLIEVEGGAALRLLDHMRVTASYRLLDVDDGQQTRSSRVGLDTTHMGAPFLGLALDF